MPEESNNLWTAMQGIFAAKLTSCLRCDFFHLVEKEEGDNLIETEEIFRKLDEEPEEKP